MKRTLGLVCSIAAALLFLGGTAGCNKGGGAGETPKTIQEGMTQMQASLSQGPVNASAQTLFYNRVQAGFRYDNYADAISALEQMQADASLKPEQKKLAGDLVTLFKAKMQGAPAAGAPAK
jgi:hypothetical protein